MINKKIKNRNFVLMLIATIMVIVALFAVTGAWFTQHRSAEFGGTVAKASGTVSCNAGLTGTSPVFTLAQYDLGDTIVTQPQITVNSTSTINSYLRVRFDINWSTLDNNYGSVFDYVDFDLTSNWYAKDSTITNDNEKIQSGWVYYMFEENSVIKLKNIELQNNITDLDQALILNGITLKADMPDSVNITVYAEFIEANNLGAQKFGF